MPRNISATVSTNISKPITVPSHLIQIDFDPVLRYSTAGDVNWNGHLWSGDGGVDSSGITEDGGRFSVQNTNFSFSSLLLSVNPHDIQVTVYEWYETEAELLTIGFISDTRTRNTRVNVDIAGSRSDISRAPTERYRPPLTNYLPRAGEVFVWDNLRITFEAPPDEF